MSKIQLNVNAELLTRLIKSGRKKAKVDLYAGLKPAEAATAIDGDVAALLAKVANKSTGSASDTNAIIALLDNVRSLNFKTTYKPAKANAKDKTKDAKKAKPTNAKPKVAKEDKKAKPVKGKVKAKTKVAKEETAKAKAKPVKMLKKIKLKPKAD